MKKTIKSTFFIFISVLSYAQSGQKWSTNGNITSSGDFIGTTNNDPLILKSNNIEGLRLKPNGNLIIKSLDLNASAPSGLVLTNGQGVISRLDFNINSNQVLFSNGSWGNLPIIPAQNWIETNGTLSYTHGNVGIGTTNPLFPLDVIGDARVSNNLYVGGGVVISDKISAITEVKGWDFKVDNDISIEGSSRLKGATRLDQGFTFDGINGVSLINTPSGQIMRYGNKTAQILPLSCAAGPLSTSFTQQFGGAIQIFDNNNPTTSGLLNLQTWTGGSSIDASVAGNSQAGLLINFFCGSNTYINTGNLGGEVFLGKSHIGNPLNSSSSHFNDALLTVNGKIVSKSMFVTQQNWADFVFENDYKIPTLTEIESYYKTNKHLPNIPSAKEVAENGIDLGEMNKLLLQKIEELTILMVQQEKRIKELENKQ